MKRNAIIVICSVVLLGLVFYGSSQARTTAPGIKVGVLITSSGPLYFAGAFQKAAAELAKKDLAKIANLEISYQDPGDSEIETENALKVFAKNKVDLILAPIDSGAVKRTLVAKELPDVPLIAASAVSEKLPRTKKLLRLASTVSQDSFALAQYISIQGSNTVAVVAAQDDYSKSVARSVSFALSLRSVRVKNHFISQNQALRSIEAQALVLVSMEQSAQLLEKLPNWLASFNRVYLVPGNLANYSSFSFAKELAGATGLLPAEEHSQSFRQRLASQMGRPEILGAPNSPMFGLARRTYQALALAADQVNQGSDLTDLAKNELFTAEGFYAKPRYSVVRYSTSGVYSLVGSFDPKIP